MTRQNVEIRCGRCNGPIGGSENPQPDEVVSCQNCGNSAPFSTVMKSVERYAVDVMEARLVDDMERAFKNCSSVSLKGGRSAPRAYDFVLDM